MSSLTHAKRERGSKKKKEVKKEPRREPSNQVVVRDLANNTYSGVLKEGQLGSQYLECASGKYTWTTGTSYEGSFLASSIEGRGKFQWPDGSSYEGELHNGRRHGEGTYLGADSVTKYAGQWLMGKRHGRGKLTYNAEGTSFYEGGWRDGKKHGNGKQMWPSGNTYEGQWELGKMRGHGTMVWLGRNEKAGTHESYTGTWEDNQPHGEGSFTWHACEPPQQPAQSSTAPVAAAGQTSVAPAPPPTGSVLSGGSGPPTAGAPPPSAGQGGGLTAAGLFKKQPQQQNNRYEGQWRQGKREGLGTFFYADGSYYHGEWRDHLKQGMGRHTFEDGHVFEGPFERDMMMSKQDCNFLHQDENGTGVTVENSVVTKVAVGSQGDRLGVKPGWKLHLIDGEAYMEDDGEGLGSYRIMLDGVDVGTEIELSSAISASLHKGAVVGVVEIVEVEERIRGRIEDPPGWISLKNTATGFRWAVKEGMLSEAAAGVRPFNLTFLVPIGNGPQDGMTFSIGATSTAGAFYDENPIKKCTDIQDLQAVALPSDCAGFEPLVNNGYTQPTRILREIYSMLLRNLGDLRDIYNRYRMLLPMGSSDPFLIKSYQCWMFARDFGLITPTCPLARFNRAVFSGPRHHREVAPDDMNELRPFTPRPPTEERRASVGSGVAAPAADDLGIGSPMPVRPSSQESSQPSQEGGSVESSRTTSPSNERQSILGQDTPPASADASPNVHRHETLGSPAAGDIMLDEAMPAHAGDWSGGSHKRETKFQRKSFSKSLVSTHDAPRTLLFRQFLEGMVRFSLARFPVERGLESQVQRLFKERLAHGMQTLPVSEDIMSFMIDKDYTQIFDQHHTHLWGTFQGLAAGEIDAGNPASSAFFAGINTPSPSAARPTTSGYSHLLPARLSCLGNFGSPQRQLHVNARFDATIRVKDLLKLFDRIGFLRPMPVTLHPQDDLDAQVFTHPIHTPPDDGSASADENASGGSAVDGLDEDKALKGFGGSPLGFMPKMPGADIFGELGGQVGGQETDFGSLLGQPREEQEQTHKGKKGRKDKDKSATPENAPPDLSRCDFTLTAYKALVLVVEIMSPGQKDNLHWRLDMKSSCGPADSRVALLDYAETELIFAEFLRILNRVAEEGTSGDTALCERLSPPQRLDCFLKQIFLPALQTPYAPPVIKDLQSYSRDTESKAGDGDRGVPGGLVPEDDPEQGEGEDGSKEGEGDAPEEVPTIELWHGYEDGSQDGLVGILQTSRRWVENYEQEVAEW